MKLGISGTIVMVSVLLLFVGVVGAQDGELFNYQPYINPQNMPWAQSGWPPQWPVPVDQWYPQQYWNQWGRQIPTSPTPTNAPKPSDPPPKLSKKLLEKCAREPGQLGCSGVPRIDCNSWPPEGKINVVQLYGDEVKSVETAHPYTPKADLEWVVYAPCNMKLQFKVKTIECAVATDGICANDGLQFGVDGTSAILTEKICGSKPGQNGISVKNSLFIKFTAGENKMSPMLDGVSVLVRVASNKPWN